MNRTRQERYDAIIVGSGFAGANMALLLARAGKRVLVLEAGPGLDTTHGDLFERYLLATIKTPTAPYPPDAGALDPSHTNAPRPTTEALLFAWDDPARSYLEHAPGSLPFGSTSERLAGGTGNHWMGTAIRMDGADFTLRSTYGHGLDWPLGYDELEPYYRQAEQLIGVAGNRAEQEEVNGIPYGAGYDYPQGPIPPSHGDRILQARVDGAAIAADSPAVARTTSTPAGRNAGPFMNRSPCRGSTSCTPICPVRAKYDPRATLRMALDTGRVELAAKAVVDAVHIDEGGVVTGLHYLTYDDVSVPAATGRTGEGLATADVYVLAAHAIENARILLNTERATGRRVANSSGLVGRHLMDHPVYLAWGLMPAATPFYGYRGPQSTSGIETFRDGSFRRRRAAWRIEIGNGGWTWPIGDPYVTGADFVYGRNDSGVNPDRRILANREYVAAVNGILTRQLRLAFLVEQEADPSNRVELSDAWTDNLGIPRPRISYGISDYVRAGFAAARRRHRAHHGPARRHGPYGDGPGRAGSLSPRRPGLQLPRRGPHVRHPRHGERPRQFRGERLAADLGPPQPVSRRLRLDAERRHAEPHPHHARAPPAARWTTSWPGSRSAGRRKSEPPANGFPGLRWIAVGAFKVDGELQELTGNQPAGKYHRRDGGHRPPSTPGSRRSCWRRRGVGVSKKDSRVRHGERQPGSRATSATRTLRSSGFETVDEVVFRATGTTCACWGARDHRGFRRPGRRAPEATRRPRGRCPWRPGPSRSNRSNQA